MSAGGRVGARAQGAVRVCACTTQRPLNPLPNAGYGTDEALGGEQSEED